MTISPLPNQALMRRRLWSIIINMKTCTRCGETKPESEYHKAKKGKGGLTATCKECNSAYAKAWAQTPSGIASKKAADERYKASENGKTKRTEYMRSAAMAEVRARYRETDAGQDALKRYRASEKRKEVLRRYYESGKGKQAINRYQQTEKGKESLLRGVHKRRTAMTLTICDLTAEQWSEIQQRQDHRCAICGETKKLTRDHIISLSKGGQHTAANIQALCRSCNSRKNHH